jgi:CheY-like chemotaxis protein
VAEWTRVDAGGRWDALALMRALAGAHTYLVQNGSAHWDLYFESDGTPAELEARIRDWLAERSLAETAVWHADGTRAVVRAAENGGRAADRRRLRLVLADDCEAMRALLSACFERWDAIELVGAVGDGQEAVRLALGSRADVVLLDVEMPVCDGVRAAEALRLGLPGATVILLTANPGSSLAAHARAQDFALVDKLQLGEVLDRVRKLVSGRC